MARGNGLLLDTATNNTEAAFVGTASTGRLSDQEVRDRARPANILAALRREREFPQAATRFVDHECERELRSTSTSHQTSERDWEIPREVDRRDERTMECAPFNARQNPDARSGGNGNAAGPGPEVRELELPIHEDHCELVPGSTRISTRRTHANSCPGAMPSRRPRSTRSPHGPRARGTSPGDFSGTWGKTRDSSSIRGTRPWGAIPWGASTRSTRRAGPMPASMPTRSGMRRPPWPRWKGSTEVHRTRSGERVAIDRGCVVDRDRTS